MMTATLNIKTSLRTLAFLGAASFVLTGCLSDEEKAARRACALDVSGDYAEIRADGIPVGALTIQNEADKNDVKAIFTRGALYDGEQAYLDRLANAADKEALSTSITLGEGDNGIARELAGGENISSDFGASSTLSVGIAAKEAIPSVEGAVKAKVGYSLSVDISNGTDELKGVLHLVFSEERPNATSGDKELHSEPLDIPVTFKRGAGALDVEQSDACKAIVANDGHDEASTDQ